MMEMDERKKKKREGSEVRSSEGDSAGGQRIEQKKKKDIDIIISIQLIDLLGLRASRRDLL